MTTFRHAGQLSLRLLLAGSSLLTPELLELTLGPVY